MCILQQDARQLPSVRQNIVGPFERDARIWRQRSRHICGGNSGDKRKLRPVLFGTAGMKKQGGGEITAGRIPVAPPASAARGLVRCRKPKRANLSCQRE